MHKYRREARYQAWYDQEGEPTSHNPFKKFRRAPRRTNSIQLERRLPLHTSTAGEVSLSQDVQRHRDMTAGLGGPVHAESFPAYGAGPDSAPRAASLEKSEPEPEPEPSMRSCEPLNVSKQGQQAEMDGKPRKRKGLLGKLGRRAEDKQDAKLDDAPEDKQKFTAVGQFKATVLNSWINVLLVAAPVGIALNYVNVDPVAVFVVNFIAIVYASDPSSVDHRANENSPLAALLSYATEEIALRTGETFGGLLNATFGNAVELIVAIIALVDDEVLIVQTSLIGSMLSNLLLVMGMSFFFGGINRVEQHFNPVVAQTAASLLALAVGSLIIPTAFQAWSGAESSKVAELSRGTSIILLVVYGCYLFFQLRTHIDMYNAPSKKSEKRNQKVSEGDTSRGIAQIGQMTGAMAGLHNAELQEPEDEPEEPQLSIFVAILTLAIATTFVALCAEFMVGSVNALTERGGISKTFVGLILLPIVGNAAEHATAVTVATKDKMDLSIGVAVGSSMQIALLVLPLIVVIGWIMGKSALARSVSQSLR
ncbi:hypothetical protein AOCH_006063 [Aspergillus ochraceoroseus]|uniref:Sodium/calcium exchanger membrane region domain-containing protein n=1 Tax=Aspergillus ochraceoroseus TaxID=138278 RepID=A0A0F8UYG1_9EURO|nr:hypothetical protein AOCH_006063 [Aspergillus ochraceoroseus]